MMFWLIIIKAQAADVRVLMCCYQCDPIDSFSFVLKVQLLVIDITRLFLVAEGPVLTTLRYFNMNCFYWLGSCYEI